MTRRYQHSPQYLRAHAKRVERKRAAREAKAQEPKTYYVYMLQHRTSLKQYIGCTSNISQRIKFLLRGAPLSAIASDIRQYGESSFEKIVLRETHDKIAASLFQIAYIAKIPKDKLYNAAVHIPYARNSSTPRPRQICACPECGASHTRKKGSDMRKKRTATTRRSGSDSALHGMPVSDQPGTSGNAATKEGFSLPEGFELAVGRSAKGRVRP